MRVQETAKNIPLLTRAVIMQRKLMKMTLLKYMSMTIFLVLIPSTFLSAIEEKSVPGIYRSKLDHGNIIVLSLNPDHSALIGDKFWDRNSYKYRTENNFIGTWGGHGNEIIVTYNGIDQILTYHESLGLEEYGIKDGVPGLRTSDKNTNYGLLDSVKLWHQDELKRILNDRPIKYTVQPLGEKYWFASLSTFIIFVFLLSAILGFKKRIVGGVAGAMALPFLCYVFLDKEGLELFLFSLIGFVIGSVAGFLASIILSGMRGKGHNTGPSYMGGFGGGRGGGLPGGIILSDEERNNLKK